jgi:hypothetical protein
MNIDLSAAINELNKVKQQAPAMIIQAIETACIEVLQKARMLDTYKDQTHRLRSSLGYVIYKDGQQVASNFQSTGGEKGDEGVQIGQQRAAEAAAGIPGIVAVVVAGADYASYVEAKGFDVLTGSALQLQQLFEAELRNLQLI